MGRKLVFLVVVGFLLVVSGVGMMNGSAYLQNRSDAYRLSEEFIRADPEIGHLVGREMEFGWYAPGAIQTLMVGDEGEAAIDITVKGAKGSTKVNLILKKDGHWWITEASYLGSDGVLVRLYIDG